MKLYYTLIDLPTGLSVAAATDDGLARLVLRVGSLHCALDELRESFGAEPSQDAGPFAKVKDELDAFFAGELAGFKSRLDLRGTPFQVKVWRALLDIPYGELKTYGWVAKSVGAPDAARAVGGAVGANPVPIIVPCHRVIASGGRLGGYSEGLDIKRRLLTVEHSIDRLKAA